MLPRAGRELLERFPALLVRDAYDITLLAGFARAQWLSDGYLPVREQTEVVGHAVRAMYLYSAMIDLSKELNDPSLFQTCERLWQHLTSRRLYITGGVGSSGDNEGITTD